MKKSPVRRFGRDEQGAVILETALMLTILLMLMFGIFDIGRALYTANTLTSAAREAARSGAVNSVCGTLADSAKATAMHRFTPFGGSGLTTGQITILPSSGCPNSGTGSVRVQIKYPFSWITPLPRLLNWTGSTDTLHVAAEYKYEP